MWKDPENVRLPCPRCQTEVPVPVPTDVDPHAVCPRCGSIFAGPLPKNRMPVLPRGVRVETTGERTELIMRWFRPVFLFMLPGILIVYFKYLRNETGFGLVLSYMLIGISAYSFLAGTFNRSVIRLDTKRLTARHGPFPLQAGVNVCTDRVESFFVEARKRHTAYSYRTYHYVVARLKGSARAEVLKNVNPLERAVAVQRALDDALKRMREQGACP